MLFPVVRLFPAIFVFLLCNNVFSSNSEYFFVISFVLSLQVALFSAGYKLFLIASRYFA